MACVVPEMGGVVRSQISKPLSSAILLALAGCASPHLATNGPVAVVSPGQLPAPAGSDLLAGARPHLVGPGDTLSVNVLGLPELSEQVRVDSSGKIALPLAGSSDVRGLQPE